ncbi:hypothetical protein RHSIM_Rhsim01G0051500 [Rhododendron simsii]|uniref:Uncharacterized protein n=1 Tax=Rhododendron simsii TaxID=118357 RepID=A0A834HHU6_RHOSS|nr:hypothetical protein RHSIM_Rhsim01G0051500 [Rhododendron simsii]
MADKTRSQEIKRLEELFRELSDVNQLTSDSIKRLTDASTTQAASMAALNDTMEGIKNFVSTLNSKYEQLQEKNRGSMRPATSFTAPPPKPHTLLPKTNEFGGNVRRLTPKDFDEKRAKGLCFGCDEKYFRGHVCTKKQLYMIEVEDDEDEFVEAQQEMLPDDNPEEFHISVHALSGIQSYKTMRVKGYIKKTVIHILVDFGSTHNFLHPGVAKKAGVRIQSIKPLTVVVADGTKISSKAMVKNLHWTVQDTDFVSDMRLLPLGGCDMVLGVQWLSTLGTVLWDFQNLQMQFSVLGKQLVLQGVTSTDIQVVDVKRMQHLLNKNCPGVLAQLCSIQVDKPAELDNNSVMRISDGRGSFLRWKTLNLGKDSFELRFPNGVTVVVGIKYHWHPLKCMGCRVFGHSDEYYPLRGVATTSSNGPVGAASSEKPGVVGSTMATGPVVQPMGAEMSVGFSIATAPMVESIVEVSLFGLKGSPRVVVYTSQGALIQICDDAAIDLVVEHYAPLVNPIHICRVLSPLPSRDEMGDISFISSPMTRSCLQGNQFSPLLDMELKLDKVSATNNGDDDSQDIIATIAPLEESSVPSGNEVLASSLMTRSCLQGNQFSPLLDMELKLDKVSATNDGDDDSQGIIESVCLEECSVPME